MASLIILLGFVSLIVGLVLRRRLTGERQIYSILSMILIGVGILALGYLVFGQLGYALLYYIWR